MNNFNQHYLSSLIFSPLLYVHKDTHHRENNLYTAADNKQTTDQYVWTCRHIVLQHFANHKQKLEVHYRI